MPSVFDGDLCWDIMNIFKCICIFIDISPVTSTLWVQVYLLFVFVLRLLLLSLSIICLSSLFLYECI